MMYRGNEPLDVTMERFFAKTMRGENGCLLWLGKRKNNGYGQFRVNNKQDYTHRWAYYFAHGTWPDKFVCHKCDNGMCVEATHLFLGTHADNMRDASSKGRIGSQHILSRETRELILAECHAGKLAQRAIAAKYNTTQSTVSEINRGLHPYRDNEQNKREQTARFPVNCMTMLDTLADMQASDNYLEEVEQIA